VRFLILLIKNKNIALFIKISNRKKRQITVTFHIPGKASVRVSSPWQPIIFSLIEIMHLHHARAFFLPEAPWDYGFGESFGGFSSGWASSIPLPDQGLSE
jgi:hypothetical protein